MRQGKVKWYNGKKCFGFITPDTPNENGNTDDVFVHSSALKEAGIRFLNENDIVEFDEEVRNDKLSVTKLVLVQRDEESARLFHERRAERRRVAEHVFVVAADIHRAAGVERGEQVAYQPENVRQRQNKHVSLLKGIGHAEAAVDDALQNGGV